MWLQIVHVRAPQDVGTMGEESDRISEDRRTFGARAGACTVQKIATLGKILQVCRMRTCEAMSQSE